MSNAPPRRLAVTMRLAALIVVLATVLAAVPAAGALPSGFSERTVLTGLNQPTSVAFAPDGRVFVTEKAGLVRVFDGLGDTTPTTLADLRTNVHNFWDRGLMGLVLDPAFPTRPYVYVAYTYDAPIGGTAPRWGTPGATTDDCPSPPGGTADGCVVSARVSRLQVSPANTQVGAEHVLLNDWCQQFPGHTIDDLAFGPAGALYVSGGDGAAFTTLDWGQLGGSAGSPTPANPCGDPPGGAGTRLSPPTAEGGSLRAQDLRTAGDPLGLNGSVIRIDPDTGQGLPDNPLAGSSDPNARRMVAHGFRNPYRIAIRPGTSEVWVGDVGDTRWEEVDRIVAPTGGVANFGWPCYEGAPRQPNWDFNNLALCEGLYAAGGVTEPHFAYAHNTSPVVPGDTCNDVGQGALAGLEFFTGTAYPATYAGALFFADYVRDCIWVLPAGAGGVPDPALGAPFQPAAQNPVDLELGPGGDLYYLNFDGGTLRRIEYDAGNAAPTAVATATPAGGPVPLAVTFDGRGSSDPDGDTLTYAWDLDGDGAFDDATQAVASRTYPTPATITVGLRVRDPAGLTATNTVLVTPGNSAPQPTIAAPAAGVRWGVGDVIAFAGGATDPESGTLPASALRWTLILHHCATPTECHEHSIQDFVGVAGGTVVAPEHEYPSYIEFRLTATDAAGLQASASVRIEAAPVQLTFLCVPPGLSLSVGSTVAATPFTYTAIRGATTALAAPDQTLAGRPYVFRAWSDGGAASHAVAPTVDTTFTAAFDPVGGDGGEVVTPVGGAGGPEPAGGPGTAPTASRAAARVVIPRRSLGAALWRGLPVVLEGFRPGRVLVRALSAGRVVASGVGRVRAGGTVIVVLRFTKGARARLGARQRVVLTIYARKLRKGVELRPFDAPPPTRMPAPPPS